MKNQAGLVDFIGSDNNKVLFNASSSKLDSGDKKILDSLKDILDQYPNANIIIEGYASSDGSSKYNMKLSEQRAASVKVYLESIGVDSARLQTIGFGESKLSGDNSTTKGRANSRRAKINRSASVSIN